MCRHAPTRFVQQEKGLATSRPATKKSKQMYCEGKSEQKRRRSEAAAGRTESCPATRCRGAPTRRIFDDVRLTEPACAPNLTTETARGTCDPGQRTPPQTSQGT